MTFVWQKAVHVYKGDGLLPSHDFSIIHSERVGCEHGGYLSLRENLYLRY